MPKTIIIPFRAVKFNIIGETDFMMPLTDSNAIQPGNELPLLAGKYTKILQEKVLNKGEMMLFFNEYREGHFDLDVVWVDFPKSKDDISFPAFSLEFEYLFQENEKGFWAIVPTLGLEVFVTNISNLEEQLKESIRLEFSRKRRLLTVHQIVAAIWFEKLELFQKDIELKTYAPSEIDENEKKQQKSLLPDVAQKLAINKKVVFGRDQELAQFAKLLSSNFAKNILLVGASGVGKTALVWEISHQKKKLDIQPNIWETTASKLIKDLTLDTGWQDNLVHLCKELKENGEILFVRNFAELFEVGKYEGNEVSMADFLRPFISRGEIALISECTNEELAKIELKSPNYSSFFQIIRLEEPRENLEEIILKKVTELAKIRKINLSKDSIKEVIRLNRRFNPYAGFPGKPIRFLEGILINKSSSFGEEKKEAALKPKISKEEVIQYFCNESGMPKFMVDASIPMDLKQIKVDFNNQVYGQEDAIESVGNVLASIKTAMTRTGKPIASFLFVGPTGVGKTELAKVLSEFMFGRRDRMIRFDMSEYSSAISVMRLAGMSYFSDGLLTSAVRREPFSVLLFDEIEKAHSSFYDLLLQILSEGRLTDSQGKLVNFCSTIIIMTSNIGAKKMQNRRIGWNKEVDVSDITNHFKTAVEKHFRPELYNRIDQIIPFKPLSKEVVRFVVEREVEIFRKREGIQFRNLNLEIEEAVLDYISEKGYDPKFGARQLQRTLREKLISPLSKKLNLHDFDDQIDANLSLDTADESNPKILISLEEDIFGGDLLLEQWDKINFADHASQLRRKIFKLKEGHYYVRLLSKLDVLENQKKTLEEDFWKRQKRSEEYSYYLHTKSNVDELATTIEKCEMDISLACMDLATYSVDFEEKLKGWEKSFFNLKLEIYRRLYPKSDKVILGIYGTQFFPLLDFYLSLAEGKNFKISGKTVWFRESFYNEEIIDTKLSTDEENQEIIKRKREEYLKKDWAINQADNYKAALEGDILYGIELEILGTCANLFFKNEKGFQKWKTPEFGEQTFFIKTANKSIDTPINIHRQEYYKSQNPRRTFEQNTIKDTKLKVNREIKKEHLSGFFLDIFEKNFEQSIDETVL